ncbi:MAG: TRAP transporter substrate-binding protein [Treponema sp.]|nr:TRAP transporter substrate-binding protein [Treponema sp.]
MKKIVLYVLLVTTLAMLFTSCKFNEKKASVKKHAVILRFAESHAAGYPTALADQEFARLVEEKTDGRVKVEVRTGGSLSEVTVEAIEGLKTGDIAFSRISSSPLSTYVPKYRVLGLPYIYRSASHMWAVLNGTIGQGLLEDVEKSGSGLVGLCYYDGGSRNFYSKKEINSLADMQGLRIRAQGAMVVDMCEALGAVPMTGIGMSEVRGNLENDVIDTAENNWATYVSTGDYTAAKYYILDQHTRVPELLVASQKVLSRLDQKDVEAIKEAAKVAQEYEIAKWRENESASEKVVRANGNTIIELSASALSEFQDAMQPLYDKYASQYRSLISEIQAIK